MFFVSIMIILLSLFSMLLIILSLICGLYISIIKIQEDDKIFGIVLFTIILIIIFNLI